MKFTAFNVLEIGNTSFLSIFSFMEMFSKTHYVLSLSYISILFKLIRMDPEVYCF